MALSYVDAAAIFQSGRYEDLLRTAGIASSNASTFEAKTRILLAHALALTGRFAYAGQIAATDRNHSSSAVRSRAETILAIGCEAGGSLSAAYQHHQAAIAHARESGELELVAWATLS